MLGKARGGDGLPPPLRAIPQYEAVAQAEQACLTLLSARMTATLVKGGQAACSTGSKHLQHRELRPSSLVRQQPKLWDSVRE